MLPLNGAISVKTGQQTIDDFFILSLEVYLASY